MEQVDRPKAQKFIGAFYSVAELEELFEVAKGDPLEFPILMAAFYGLRRSEIVGLKWQAVDLESDTITVSHVVIQTQSEGKFKMIRKDRAKNQSSCRSLPLVPQYRDLMIRMKEQQAYNKKLCGNCYTDSDYIYVDPLGHLYKPNYVSAHFKLLLEKHGLRHIRFHDLRHTFATLSLQNGMDVKTLSAMLGHVSAATTLDIYTHITDDMQRAAAANIDRGIGKAEPQDDPAAVTIQPEKPRMTDFKPYLGHKRKPGTGCVSEVNDHLFEGRYSPMWPDGKKHARNVYAKTREECEEKLKALIVQMKAEIAEAKKKTAEGK